MIEMWICWSQSTPAGRRPQQYVPTDVRSSEVPCSIVDSLGVYLKQCSWPCVRISLSVPPELAIEGVFRTDAVVEVDCVGAVVFVVEQEGECTARSRSVSIEARRCAFIH